MFQRLLRRIAKELKTASIPYMVIGARVEKILPMMPGTSKKRLKEFGRAMDEDILNQFGKLRKKYRKEALRKNLKKRGN